jgi:hypothetical protein
MTEETIKEYRDGFRDALQVVDATMDLALVRLNSPIMIQTISNLKSYFASIQAPIYKR